MGPLSSRSTCRYNKIAGAPGACGSLRILSSSGEIGSQSSARAESVPLHSANTATNPCIDVRLSAGMTDSLIPGLTSVFTVHAGSRVAASMAEAPAIVEIPTVRAGTQRLHNARVLSAAGGQGLHSADVRPDAGTNPHQKRLSRGRGRRI